MPSTVTTAFSLGRSRTGLTDLRVQPRNAAGTALGSPITTGFAEIGLGIYQWTGTVPDGTVSVTATSAGTAGVLGHAVVAWTDGAAGGGEASVTFSQAAAVLGVPVPSAGTIGFYRGDSVSQQLTGLGSLVGRSRLWMTAKEVHAIEVDSHSIIQIEESGGLLVLGRAPATNSVAASLTVDNAATGTVTIAITAAASAVLPPGTYRYDVQALIGGQVRTLAAGSLVVTADVTRATA